MTNVVEFPDSEARARRTAFKGYVRIIAELVRRGGVSPREAHRQFAAYLGVRDPDDPPPDNAA